MEVCGRDDALIPRAGAFRLANREHQSPERVGRIIFGVAGVVTGVVILASAGSVLAAFLAPLLERPRFFASSSIADLICISKRGLRQMTVGYRCAQHPNLIQQTGQVLRKLRLVSRGCRRRQRCVQPPQFVQVTGGQLELTLADDAHDHGFATWRRAGPGLNAAGGGRRRRDQLEFYTGSVGSSVGWTLTGKALHAEL